MSVIEFAYTKYRDIMVPVIPIKMKGQDRWFEFWAFVDSGATYYIFASKEAEDLGVEIKQGKRIMVVVGDGSYIPVYLFKIPVSIGDIEFTAEIGFSEKLGVGFNLLGRRDIFDLFKVCFSDREEKVTFQKL
jgi:hypothetical protein